MDPDVKMVRGNSDGRPAWQSGTRQVGFTLIELLVAISIAFLLVALGVPSFLNTIRDNSIRADLQTLWSSASFARSEAIKRNAQVLLCPLNDDENDCVATRRTDWKGGWVVFMDVNRNGILDGGLEAANCENAFDGGGSPNDCVLRLERKPVRGTGRTLTWFPPTGDTKAFVSYNGLGNTRQASSFLLCDDRGEGPAEAIKYARKMKLSGSGRPHVEKAQIGSDTCPTS